MSNDHSQSNHNIFELRKDYHMDIGEQNHVLSHGFICDTDGIGQASPDGKSVVEIVLDASEGFIPLWEANTTLRWRFQQRSLSRFAKPDEVRQEVRRLLAGALLAWGTAAPVKFKEDNDLWDFEIVFRHVDECDNGGCVLASAFFPDGGRHKLLLYPILFKQSKEEQVNTLVHEIGHVFGLRHFFADIQEKDWPVEIFGKHSKFSIMNYGSLSVLTKADKDDLANLYQAVWQGSLTRINGTPIRLVKPYSSLAHISAAGKEVFHPAVAAAQSPTTNLSSFPAAIIDMTTVNTVRPLAEHYLQQLTTSKKLLESAGEDSGSAPVLTESDIKDKQEYAKDELYRIIDHYLDDQSGLKSIADKLIKDSKDPLLAAANHDDDYLRNNPDKASLLEVIVRTDGSRPSFMVRNGAVDISTSPAGQWADILLPQRTQINNALDCVGRIDIFDRHVGTGFLIHQNYILTNRHVLQAIAGSSDNINWKFREGAQIDFGREFRARDSVRPRKLVRVAFAGANMIKDDDIDHRKLDMVIIELAPAAEDERPLNTLSFDLSSEWATPGRSGFVYTIGYPAKPGQATTATYGTSLLELLFKSTYGYKRFAPGETMLPSDAKGVEWTAAHDATTLGGNSGSVVLVAGREHVAAGIHYGGRYAVPRENWAHVLGKTVTAKDASGQTIQECLDKLGIQKEDII